MHLRFKEWLSKDSPPGAGTLSDDLTNADFQFGVAGVKSKYAAMGAKSGETNFDPDELYYGKKKPKKRCKQINKDVLLGGNYGTDYR